MPPTNVFSEELRACLTKTAALLMAYPWKMWYFGDDVGLEGLRCASGLLDDDRYRSYVYGLAKGWLGRMEGWRWYDQTLPALPLLRIAEVYHDDVLLVKLREFGDWLISHPVREDLILTDDDYPDLVWADTVAFHGPFLAHLGIAIEEPQAWTQAALRFLLPSLQILSDTSGLYCHTYDTKTRTTNGVHWARGQGWVLRGLWETYAAGVLSEGDQKMVLSRLVNLLGCLAQWQRPSGHWGTVVDVKESREESSLAAFVVAVGSAALRARLMDRSLGQMVQKAWAGLTRQLDADGRYQGVSEDTLSGPLDYYLTRPTVQSAVPWGEGTVLWAAKEYGGWLALK